MAAPDRSTYERRLPAIIGRETVSMKKQALTTDMALYVFETIRDSNPELKSLDMQYNNLSEVDPSLIISAVEKLETLELKNCNLVTEQANQILEAISNDKTNIRSLDLSMNNLSEVNPDMFALAVSKLEVVTIHDTRLTPDQADAIFSAINEDSKLKSLNVADNYLSSLDIDLLLNTVTKLETLHLDNTEVTIPDLESILKQSLVETTLKHLELSESMFLDPELVGKAQQKYSIGLRRLETRLFAN